MFAVIKIPLPAHSPFVSAIIVFTRVTRAVLINPYSTTEIVKKYTSFDCITIEELRNLHNYMNNVMFCVYFIKCIH